MGQFPKNWTRKDIAMDIRKLLEDSDPLITAPELNERLPKRYKMFLLWLLKFLIKKRIQGTQNPVTWRAMFLAHWL